jgi:hypothetical protein
MRKVTLLVLGLAATVGVVMVAPARAANVNVGINIGVPPPPPPPVVIATPRFVVVPGSPVQYAPAVSFNLFVYGGRYYSFHNGAWFHSPRRGGPWVLVPMDRVPHVVRAVPATYYKVRPGPARKLDRSGPPMASPGKGPRHR